MTRCVLVYTFEHMDAVILNILLELTVVRIIRWGLPTNEQMH